MKPPMNMGSAGGVNHPSELGATAATLGSVAQVLVCRSNCIASDTEGLEACSKEDEAVEGKILGKECRAYDFGLALESAGFRKNQRSFQRIQHHLSGCRCHLTLHNLCISL